MKKTTFKIISGPATLVECPQYKGSDINVALACFEGIISKFGNGDSFSVTLNKETVNEPDPKPATPLGEKKPEVKQEVKAEVKEVKKETVKKSK